MDPARWESAKRLFQDALERPPADRNGFVREASHDSSLRAEVESLLAAHEKAGTFIDAPLSPAAAARIVNEIAGSARKLQRGDRLGPYEIVDALGAGGMGEVYRARDIGCGASRHQRPAGERGARHAAVAPLRA